MHIYEADLDKNSANYEPLCPIAFLERSAGIYPAKAAIVDGDRTITYAEMWRRCRQAADALRRAGVGDGDTVSVLSPNSIAALEMHYAAPMAGGVVNAINFRLDATTVAFILGHVETKVFLVDAELMPVAKAALAEFKGEITLVVGRPVSPVAEEAPLPQAVEQLMAGGTPRMEAIKLAARRRGLSKREVYKMLASGAAGRRTFDPTKA